LTGFDSAYSYRLIPPASPSGSRGSAIRPTPQCAGGGANTVQWFSFLKCSCSDESQSGFRIIDPGCAARATRVRRPSALLPRSGCGKSPRPRNPVGVGILGGLTGGSRASRSRCASTPG
jgi:hypothetical protein